MNPPSPHWQEIARQWDQVGPPLRPSPSELVVFTAVIEEWVRANGPARALILGVTPELYRLPWPVGTTVSAVDNNSSMIETVWPGPRNAVVCADWTELPFAPGSQDLALCDGGLSLVSHPHDHIRLVQSLHGVLAPAGLCLLRLYVPAAEPESAVAVLDELLVGKISNPNILKLRLGMALQDDPTRGVQLAHVWDVLHQAVPDLKEFAERFGWPPGPWLAINTYRECARWYHFLTVAEVDHLFTRAPGGFTRELLQTPPGEFGDRCPIVVYRSRRSDSAGDGGE